MLMMHNIKFDRENFKKFIYLFFVDTSKLAVGNTYEDHQKREPGYAKAWLRAYLYAFRDAKDQKTLSHDFLKALHKVAIAHNSEQTIDYRNHNESFGIILDVSFYQSAKPGKIIPEFNYIYNATTDGIKEFITHWMLDTPNPIHHISFKGSNIELLKLDPDKHQLCLTDISGQQKDFSVDLDKNFSLLENKIRDGEVKARLYIEAKKRISTILEKIFFELDNKMSLTTNEDERLEAIVTCIQSIDQLHPFKDGNIRTCYILLNKLLHDYGFPITLLLNPNRIDLFSKAQLINEIKHGQAYLRQVLNSQGKMFHLDSDEEAFKDQKIEPIKLTDVDDQLVNEFIDCVIIPNLTQQLAASTHHAPVFFKNAEVVIPKNFIGDIKKLTATDEAYAKILTYINSSRYSTALRIACSLGAQEIIKLLVKYKHELKIDINSRSANGKTALDFLLENKSNVKDKEAIIKLLEENGALRRIDTSITRNTIYQTSNKSGRK